LLLGCYFLLSARTKESNQRKSHPRDSLAARLYTPRGARVSSPLRSYLLSNLFVQVFALPYIKKPPLYRSGFFGGLTQC
jgi:hypothetical protein